MKTKLLLVLVLVLVLDLPLRADTPIKDIKITGSLSQIASGALAVKSGATVTFESGSTLDATAGTLKVGTVTSATNADIVLAPNGTGKIDLDKTFKDETTGNASTNEHGLQKKLSGNSYEYAGGDGNYSIPSQVPLNTQNAAYTFVLGDAGKTIFHDEVTARVYTIPANSSVAYPIGTMITIINNTSGGAITLSITTDTLRRGDGTAGTGSRTITADSVVTIIKTKSTEWFITGKFS